MINTGKFVNQETLAEILKIHERTKQSLFGPTDQTAFSAFSDVDQAVKELHEAIDQAAMALGLPTPEKDSDGDVIHYGLLGTGEITAWEGK